MAYNYLFRLQQFPLSRSNLIAIFVAAAWQETWPRANLFFGASVNFRSCENPWRGRPRVFSSRVPRALLRFGKPYICRWPPFCSDTLRNRYFDALISWRNRDVIVPSVQKRFADKIPTKSLLKKTHEPRPVTHAALNCFIMNVNDVYILWGCFGGIVHPRVTQTRPMDVSMGSTAT